MGAAASINGATGAQSPSILTIDAGKAEITRLLQLAKGHDSQPTLSALVADLKKLEACADLPTLQRELQRVKAAAVSLLSSGPEGASGAKEISSPTRKGAKGAKTSSKGGDQPIKDGSGAKGGEAGGKKAGGKGKGGGKQAASGTEPAATATAVSVTGTGQGLGQLATVGQPSWRDPWETLRSPYGGKMSPADEWKHLTSVQYYHDLPPSEGLQPGPTANPSSRLYSLTIPASAAVPLILADPVQNPESGPSLMLSAEALTASLSSGDAQGGVRERLQVASRLIVAGLDVSAVDALDALPLHSLTALDLSGNLLSVLPPLAFLPFLRDLSLAGNRLTSPPPLLAGNVPKLLRLDLSHNPLGPHLPPSSCLPPSLRSLSLQACQLVSLLSSPDPPSENSGPAIATACLAAVLPTLLVLELSLNPFSSTSHVLAPLMGAPRLTDLILPLLAVGPTTPSSATEVQQCVSSQRESLPLLSADPAYASELLRVAKSLPCLRRLNHAAYSHGSMSSVDALAEAMARAALSPEEAEGGLGEGRRQESCSCVEGNACADPYCCRDWANRFDVARRAREARGGFAMQRDGQVGRVGAEYVEQGAPRSMVMR